MSAAPAVPRVLAPSTLRGDGHLAHLDLISIIALTSRPLPSTPYSNRKFDPKIGGVKAEGRRTLISPR